MADQAEGSAQSGRGLSVFWLIVLATGVPALVLAGWGWLEVMHPRTVDDWFDWAIRTIKVLLLSDIYFDPEQIEAEQKDGVWTKLEWARAPGVLCSLVLASRLVYIAVVERAAEMWLRGRRNHSVIIGTGPAALGLANAMTGRKITHLSGELKPRGDYAQLTRVGTLEQQLAAAAAKTAAHIIVDEGDDSNTWQTAQAVANIHRDIDVLAHISDPWALEMLIRADHVRLRPFSYAGSVSRQVMLAHPPYLLARRLQAKAQHILIVGFGTVGQALMREFLITSVSANPAPMMVSVVDPDMEKAKHIFAARYPELAGKALDIEFLGGDLREENNKLVADLKARSAVAEICAAYVAIDDASLPLSVAVAIKERAQRLNLFRAPVFLCAQNGAGLLQIRNGAGLTGRTWMQSDRKKQSIAFEELELEAKTESLLCDLRLVAFGTWANSVDGAGLMIADPDAPGRSIHEAYLKKYGESTRTAGRPWPVLAEQFRASNRRAASHIRAKADAAGFDLEGWLQGGEVGAGRGAFELPGSETDARDRFLLEDKAFMRRLGELEHRRWTIEKRLEGWRYSKDRDDLTKEHFNLVAFDELSETDKDKDALVIEVTAELLKGNGRRKKPKTKSG
ncbi:MAG: RyR domain-containing protein [Hyphomonadaceae bacterium]|nr:RyR domain-containing protein [Hyphomonadaceae bacterium]